jgi:hypothetical protein
MGGKARSERVLATRNGTVPLCKGANYHVFALGASQCSVCGWNRYPHAAHTAPPAKLFAFWRYDLFPFVLGGPVEEFGTNGAVYIKSYQNWFKPIRILRYEEGAEIWAKLSALRERYGEEIKALDADYKAQAEEIFGEKLK